MMDNIVPTIDEIIKYCKEINIHKASSVQDLSSKLLKLAFLRHPEKLKYIFDQIADSGIFPTEWKCATIIPLKKVNNTNLVNELRPISLLPLPSKILEKIIHNRMIEHLESNDLLDTCQGGFRKNNSTVNTTVRFTNDIFNAINRRHLSIATFVDMAKAFDTVNHTILLNKLESLGFTGKIINLLRNYLTDRKQSTLANGVVSSLVNISCGIPQGSTVGPLMYIIYMNDVSTSLNHCKYQLYADDTVIYLSDDITNLNDATNRITTDLESFKYWCDMNKLTLNVKKTKYVTFGLKSQTRKVINHTLQIGTNKIERVPSYKYLGIILDSNLNYKKHIENCIKSASYKAMLLSKIRKYITFEASVRIYKTMILPLIDYGDILYEDTNQVLLSKLQTLQNRCLRTCVYKNYHISVNDLHEICTVVTLNKRRIMHLILFMFKQKCNADIVNNRNVNTRVHDAQLFMTSRPNSEKYKVNVLYKGAMIWNSMTVAERSIETYEKLKKYLKTKH